jgi:hypothetical protein
MANQYEVAIVSAQGNGWNGDFAIDDTGDLVLAVDSATTSDATVQRCTRMLMTSPQLFDPFGNPIGEADDIFHPTYGAGLRAEVGENFDDAVLAAIKARILNALASDPGVAQTPAPTVNILSLDAFHVAITVQINTVTGQQAVLATLRLTAAGA